MVDDLCALGFPLQVLPVGAAIGGFANPTVFVIAAFDPDFWTKTHWKIYAAISFIITTTGFMGVELPCCGTLGKCRQIENDNLSSLRG